MPTLCIAHRGASAEAPENTLLAFARALELGVDGIELDVQVTRDGVAVVFHDFTLTRLTGTRGRLADRTWAQLQKLRVDGEPIPTLAEALSLTRGHTILQIEIKKGAPVAPVLAAIRRTASTKHIILASFEHDILHEAAALAPKLPRMLIADPPIRSLAKDPKGSKEADSSRTQASKHLTTESTKITEAGRAVIHHSLCPSKPSGEVGSLAIRNSSFAMHLLGAMASVGASGISVAHRAITSPLFVETIHHHGAQLWCWTVNDVGTMRRLSSFSVDAILTDDPAKLIKTLRV